MIIAFVIAIIVLVTGGFTYQYVAQQKPLENDLQQAQLSTVHLPIQKNDKKVTIEFVPHANVGLEDAVVEIQQIMLDHAYDRDNINIVLGAQESSELDSIWQQQLFNVAEAMASQHYSKLPELMTSLEKEHMDLTAIATIDEHYVYITLRQDSMEKYVLLPIKGQEMEAWNNA